MCDLCDRVPGVGFLLTLGGGGCGQFDFRGMQQQLACLLAWLALGRRALLDLIPQTSQLTKPQRRQEQERERESCLEKQLTNGGPGGGSASAHWPHLESFLRAPFYSTFAASGWRTEPRAARPPTVLFWVLFFL